MSDLFNLDGDVALITGASRGLGREITTALAEQGADCVIGSRNAEQIRRVAGEIAGATGRQVIGQALDVTQRGSVEQFVARAMEQFGKVDILVNSAGVNVRAPIEQIRDEDWELIQKVNVTGVFYCCRAAAPIMVKAGYGRIINIASALSVVTLKGRVSYCSSKGAVLQLTRTLAVELAQTAVTVNCVCPGPFGTEINRPVMADAKATAELLSNVPMNRWGELREIRAPVVYLASRDASFVTGSAVAVDGGWMAH